MSIRSILIWFLVLWVGTVLGATFLASPFWRIPDPPPLYYPERGSFYRTTCSQDKCIVFPDSGPKYRDGHWPWLRCEYYTWNACYAEWVYE